jgi:NitT/TauT family transport system ATP-binding protein
MTFVAQATGALSLVNLSKSFAVKAAGKNGATISHKTVLKTVVSDVTLHCRPGEFVVLVGPSGCGKSTLLSMAAGMLAPTIGQVTLDAQPVHVPGPDRAVVFQDHGLFPWLTARQNIALGLKFKKLTNAQINSKTDDALAMVHLTHSGDKLPHQLSGGMRQRIAIARALALEPSVLLMDEPFSSLDEQNRTMLQAQLQAIWSRLRITVLFVTHSVNEAVRLADRVIVLHSNPGRIRREFIVELPHPRDFHSPLIQDLERRIRDEIEQEVLRANAQSPDEIWNPAQPAHLAVRAGDVGDGI